MTTTSTQTSTSTNVRLQPFRPIHMVDLVSLRLSVQGPSPFVRTRAQLVQGFADQQELGIPSFIVVSADTTIGLVLFERASHGRQATATLGVWIDQDHRSRGVGTEAVRQALVEAARCGLHRIETAVLPENSAGRRMLVRAGFTPVGLAREVLEVHGVWRDHVILEHVVAGAGFVARAA